MMRALVLGAGVGVRAAPLCRDRPKLMFRLLGRPLIDYVIEGLKESDITDLTFTVGFEKDQIINYLSGRQDINVRYAHQNYIELPSQGEAVAAGRGLFDEHFLVLNGDDLYEPNLIRRLIEAHNENPTGLTLSVIPTDISKFPHDKPVPYGFVKLENGIPVKIVEKPKPEDVPSNLAVIGAYLFSPEIFDFLKLHEPSGHQLEDAYQHYMDRGDAKVVIYDGFFSSFKQPWDLFALRDYIMKTNLKRTQLKSNYIHPSTVIKDDKGPVWIEEDVKVFEHATITGPVYIGKGSVIGTGALVRNKTVIGERSVVGYGAEISNAIIGNDCWFHRCYVADSIIEDNCNFADGSATKNWRYDSKPIAGTPYDKLGVAVGHDSMIAGSTFPGAKVGPESIVGTGVTLLKDLPPKTIIYLDADENGNLRYETKENRFIVASYEKKKELMERFVGRG